MNNEIDKRKKSKMDDIDDVLAEVISELEDDQEEIENVEDKSTGLDKKQGELGSNIDGQQEIKQHKNELPETADTLEIIDPTTSADTDSHPGLDPITNWEGPPDKISEDFSRLRKTSMDMRSILDEVRDEVKYTEPKEKGDKGDYLKSALSKYSKIESIPKPDENDNYEVLPENIKELKDEKYSLTETVIEVEPVPTTTDIKIEPVEPTLDALEEFNVDESVIDSWKNRFLDTKQAEVPVRITPKITGKKRFTRNMNIGIIRFPGTNSELETFRVLKSFGVTVRLVEYQELEKLENLNGIWIPGGYSFGDVDRPGMKAAETEIMKHINSSNLPMLAIGNGFHILTEIDKLPGVLIKNKSKRFVCDWVSIHIPESDSYMNQIAGRTLSVPIAHYQGNVFTHDSLEDFIVAQYSTNEGMITDEVNPNGSIANIAGLGSKTIVAMMPHPERAAFKYQGSNDGRIIIETFLREVKR